MNRRSRSLALGFAWAARLLDGLSRRVLAKDPQFVREGSHRLGNHGPQDTREHFAAAETTRYAAKWARHKQLVAARSGANCPSKDSSS